MLLKTLTFDKFENVTFEKFERFWNCCYCKASYLLCFFNYYVYCTVDSDCSPWWKNSMIWEKIFVWFGDMSHCMITSKTCLVDSVHIHVWCPFPVFVSVFHVYVHHPVTVRVRIHTYVLVHFHAQTTWTWTLHENEYSMGTDTEMSREMNVGIDMDIDAEREN